MTITDSDRAQTKLQTFTSQTLALAILNNLQVIRTQRLLDYQKNTGAVLHLLPVADVEVEALASQLDSCYVDAKAQGELHGLLNAKNVIIDAIDNLTVPTKAQLLMKKPPAWVAEYRTQLHLLVQLRDQLDADLRRAQERRERQMGTVSELALAR